MDWNSILQPFLVTLIQVFTPIVLAGLFALIRILIEQIKTNVDATKLALATSLAQQFVMAAEQSGLAGAIAAEGKAKKEWALSRLEMEMAKRGIKIDAHVLSDLIESAVFEFINSNKL
jgi:hypothetical protein